MQIALPGFLKVKVKRSKVYLTMVTVSLIASIGAAYFLLQTNISLPGQDLVNPDAPPVFNYMIYGGFGNDALRKPMDVTMANNMIYVTDTKNYRVQVFDLGGSPMFMFGSRGAGPGQFQFPYGVTADQKGNVYVADLYNGAISVFDAKGKFVSYFAEKDPADKLIMAPGAIRIVDNKMYVPDIMQCKVLVFDLQGKKLLEVGQAGFGPGQLKAPNCVTADKDGNIYVVDTGNQRIEIFDKTGKFAKMLNGSADARGDSVFINPRGIDIDSRGIIYVVSNLSNYIYGFDKNGKQVFVFGGEGQENDRFSLPNGLFIDDDDQVYITDSSNQRVAVYR